jgi:hypothetical protein
VDTGPATLTPETASSQPGADLSVSGSGCQPGQGVALLLGTTVLGDGTADLSGRYTVRAMVPDVPLDRYTLRALCGETSAEVPLDLVHNQSDC